jgi:4-amino-4-deoxy-L-arabinose transferase-like glycosyltransferase
MYAAAAGAVLTKGLIGVVLPGAVVFLWLVFTGRWSLLKDMRLVTGTLLFLLIAAPWHILVAMRNPEWAHFYFIHEHFQRYATREAGRYQPVWFFAAVLLAGLFPWLTFIYQAKKEALKGFWNRRHEDGKPLFLVIWVGFIFVFFSLSDSKLIPYILPVFPPLAAMLGRYFAAAWEEKPAPYFNAGLWTTIFLLLVIAIVPSLLLDVLDKSSKISLALTQGGGELQTLSMVCMIAAGALLVTYIQGRRRHVIMGLILTAGVILQLGDQVGAHYNKDSMQTFGKIINAAHKPDTEVAMYQVYYQDMPIYVKGRITIADWKGELDFGTKNEDTTAWMMSGNELWKRWLKNDHLMFMVMRNEVFERLTKDKKAENLHLNLIEQEGRNILFMNRLPEPSHPPSKENKIP